MRQSAAIGWMDNRRVKKGWQHFRTWSYLALQSLYLAGQLVDLLLRQRSLVLKILHLTNEVVDPFVGA